MSNKFMYSLGAAAIVLTLGTAAMAATPVSPKTMPDSAGSAAPSAQVAPDMNWTGSGSAPQGAVGGSFVGSGSSQFGQRGMTRGGFGGGFSRGSMRGTTTMRNGGSMYAAQNANHGKIFFSLMCVAAGITLLLSWIVLILMIIALLRHLRKK
jgi:hypothetical protein